MRAAFIEIRRQGHHETGGLRDNAGEYEREGVIDIGYSNFLAFSTTILMLQ